MRLLTMLGLFVSVGFSLAESVAFAQDRERHIETTFIHEGGMQFVFRPGSFELWSHNDGLLRNEGFLLQTSDLYRPGCFITTPWVPVAGDASRATLMPGFTVLWFGTLPRTDPVEVGLTKMYVEIRDLQGNIDRRAFDVVTTRNVPTRPAAYPDSEHTTYRASMQTGVGFESPLPYDFDINGPATVRIKMCMLVPNAYLDVHNFALRTFPTH